MHSSMQQRQPAAPPAPISVPVAHPKPSDTDGDVCGSRGIARETGRAMVDSVSIPCGLLTLTSEHCITIHDAAQLTASADAALQAPALVCRGGLRFGVGTTGMPSPLLNL